MTVLYDCIDGNNRIQRIDNINTCLEAGLGATGTAFDNMLVKLELENAPKLDKFLGGVFTKATVALSVVFEGTEVILAATDGDPNTSVVVQAAGAATSIGGGIVAGYLGGVLGGAILGAGAGSVAPGWGTIIGGVVGGVAAALWGEGYVEATVENMLNPSETEKLRSELTQRRMDEVWADITAPSKEIPDIYTEDMSATDRLRAEREYVNGVIEAKVMNAIMRGVAYEPSLETVRGTALGVEDGAITNGDMMDTPAGPQPIYTTVDTPAGPQTVWTGSSYAYDPSDDDDDARPSSAGPAGQDDVGQSPGGSTGGIGGGDDDTNPGAGSGTTTGSGIFDGPTTYGGSTPSGWTNTGDNPGNPNAYGGSGATTGTGTRREDLEAIKDEPILLDLDGNGIKVTDLSRSTVFMVDDEGLKHRTAWAGQGDGVLFYDVGNDGKIEETREYVFTEWVNRPGFVGGWFVQRLSDHIE